MQDAMRRRTSRHELEQDAADALSRSLDAVGLVGERFLAAAHQEPDLVMSVPGGPEVAFEVRAVSIPTPNQIEHFLVSRSSARGVIVVADRVPSTIRRELNERGVSWLDRRGHLRLTGPGLFVDADVPPSPRRGASTDVDRDAIAGRSGLAAATGLLLRPDEPMRVSEIARVAGLNPSSITRAMASLAAANLAERRGRGQYRALVPELFWALSDVWPRTRTTVQWSGAHADPGDASWVAGGVRGALVWGAPIVATADLPIDLYLPDERTIRRLVVEHEGGEGSEVRLTVDPNGFVRREARQTPSFPWPVALPLFCALDLTATARDREALDQWTPPEEFTRVW
jgi:hypothetical protein